MSKELEALKRIEKVYEYFIKNYRELEPKLMICEKEDFDIIKTALKRIKKLEIMYSNCAIESAKQKKALDIIKENLNIDEILLDIKGVCKASDYDLVKEVFNGRN